MSCFSSAYIFILSCGHDFPLRIYYSIRQITVKIIAPTIKKSSLKSLNDLPLNSNLILMVVHNIASVKKKVKIITPKRKSAKATKAMTPIKSNM